jgi:hypothetical protein
MVMYGKLLDYEITQSCDKEKGQKMGMRKDSG